VTEGLGRKVGTELGANHSVVSVGAGDLTPDDADFGASDLLLGGVDVSDTLQSYWTPERTKSQYELLERGIRSYSTKSRLNL
jgi:hypothetical protein